MSDISYTDLKIRRDTGNSIADLLTLDSVGKDAGNGSALRFINDSATEDLHLTLGRISASRVDPTTVRLDLAVVNDPTHSSDDDTLPLLSLISEQTSPGVTRHGVLIAGSLEVTGPLRVSGNLDVTGTVDGRDVSGDGVTLDQHLANKANPHATTAAQVGALSTAGGTISGTLTVNGNVGIGITASHEPAAKLDIVGTIRSTAQTIPSSGEGLEVIYAGNQGYLTSYNRTANTYQPLNITGATLSLNAYSDGYVGIGTTNPGFKLDVNGVVRAHSFVPPSDARLKTKITPLTGTLAKLAQMRGVAFEWNERVAVTDRSQRGRQIGVIAQEVEAVFPELVVTAESDGLKAVDYDRLAAILIEAVKELNHKIEKLEPRAITG